MPNLEQSKKAIIKKNGLKQPICGVTSIFQNVGKTFWIVALFVLIIFHNALCYQNIVKTRTQKNTIKQYSPTCREATPEKVIKLTLNKV